MSHSSSVSANRPLRAPPPCVWSYRPLDGARRQLATTAALVAIAAVAWASTDNWIVALAGAALVAAAAWPALAPTTYELNALGVESRALGRARKTPWRAIGRCDLLPTGFFLWPAKDAQVVDLFRGQFVPWTKTARDDALALLAYYLPSDRLNDAGAVARASPADEPMQQPAAVESESAS